ncbi:MAG: endonuclease/exonuclease/phosphatase family protein [Acutalibacteraceae bacterium]|nr:endonuclease/exonuclease/phosphatase family protein [Oscillospiraceae bacterium]
MFVTFYTKAVQTFLALMLCLTSLIGGSDAVKANPVEPVADSADVRVVQFNLRFSGVGKTSMEYRAPRMVAQLNEIGADSMGFQEATLEWILYLEEHLTDYARVGVARTDGKVLGEFSPVFYRKDKYNAVDSGTFWLSKNPDVPGTKNWGSQNIRICTWVLLENKETGERYVHMNAHLDHISEKARENQMKVLLRKADEFIGKYPVVLTGDFNDDDSSEMYALASEKLKDSRLTAPVTDDKDTFHNYGKIVLKGRIDYVFVSKETTPLVYHVIDDKINGDYLSDHYGIYVDLKF